MTVRNFGRRCPEWLSMASWQRFSVVVVILIALMAMRTVAASSSGGFEAVLSYKAGLQTIEYAGGVVTGGASTGTYTITSSVGGPFKVGASGLSTCITYAKKPEVESDISLEAACSAIDADGDKWFSLAVRKAGDIDAGGGGDGNLQLLGGTGKFKGLSGTCPYVVEYLSDKVHFVTTVKCTWNLQ